MPFPDDPRGRGTSPPFPPPMPTTARGESPPGALAASRLLWALSVPALALLLLVPLHLVPLHLGAEVVLGDPVLILAVLLSVGTAVLLMWNLACMVAAHLATVALLPSGAAHLLAGFVQRVGTQAARQVLARRGAAAALGTGIALSVAPVAVASPLPVAQAATASFATPSAVLPTARSTSAGPTATDSDTDEATTPLPPDDLSWGAPREPGTRAATPSPSPVGTSRTTDPPPATGSHSAATDTLHVVRPGESLWTIAAQHLGAGADNEQIALLWPRIHAANAGLIGTDPDVIHPGTSLNIPGTQP